jgi:hypothetical protein
VCLLFESECRRRAVRVLAARSGTTTRDELARVLAGEASRPESTEERREMEVRLHHVHLPKLADAGAIRYGPDAESVTLTDRGRRMDEFLRTVEADSGSPLD